METRLRLPPDPGFCLIETMRLEPQRGAVRLTLHLARLEGAAERFGLRVPSDLRSRLERLRSTGPERLRVTLDAAGQVEVTQTPFTPLAAGAIWRAGLAFERLDANDPFRRVKSSRRGIYDRARASLPAGLDEVVFLNAEDRLADGTITNIFLEHEGVLLTPPCEDGALPGVLRAALLAEGRAREAALTRADLVGAGRFFLGNSLRGLIPAVWGESLTHTA